MVKINFEADGFGKCFVESNGKNAMVKHNEEAEDGEAENDADDNFASTDGKDATKEKCVNININALGGGNNKNTNGEGGGGDERNGSVAMDRTSIM